ncbi:enamine deaminase RidA (YjgF/YER057c/UK114 family) [Aminobacter niigataensis]|uniref:Enamine deaminase RidA (YjgF/YER057c/UK114 family) n=1 Tax=Aminobacter niigataensis TaxID=83265 RepID=A0ABR6L3V9_9HYPH|nr:Rid family hydrolase [Aminobacter niigataensis]MBB4651487.1 enamine deaminase RidA (YjgF/YER057c/UK114 family) [Aminobacter niigataensis]
MRADGLRAANSSRKRILSSQPILDTGRQRLSPANHWDWHIPTPFSQGWRIGPMVFVGGQLSADKHGNVVGEGDIELQTQNVFDNITRVLASAGATWKDVVKLNTYYVFDGQGEEIQEFWEKMTRVRLRYISDPGPAATAVRVAGLMYEGFLIEAEVVAVIGGQSAAAAFLGQ